MNWRTTSDSLRCSSSGLPGTHDLAARKQETVVRDGRELLHVVRHDDAGDAQRLVHLLDEAADHAHRNRVEADEGLVVDQDVRVHDDGARQRHAPRHATREFRRHQSRRAAQAHRMQLGEHQVADQGFGQFGVCAQRKRDVFIHVEIGEQARRSGTACPCAGAARTTLACQVRDVHADDQDPARVGPDLAA